MRGLSCAAETVANRKMVARILRSRIAKPVYAAGDNSGPVICVLDQRHEPEIHVQLHVAMKQCGTGIIRHKLHLPLLPRWDAYYVLPYASGGPAAYFDQLERVPVQVYRMSIIGVVVEYETILPPA